MHKLFFVLFFIVSCTDFSYNGKGEDIPTAGNIEIGFERGDSMLVMQWLDQFHLQYPKSKIIPRFLNYSELVEMFKSDSLPGIFLHGKFSEEEMEWFKQKRNATVNEIVLGQSSVAFIANKNMPLEKLTRKNIIEIYGLGDEPPTKFIALSSFKGIEIRTIFDSAKAWNVDSSILRKNRVYFKELGSDQKVIDFVKSNPKYIGLVSLNSIADKKDPLAVENAKSIKVLKIESHTGEFHAPFQSQIKAKQYPFVFPLISYEAQGYDGLMKGFVIFTNSQPGQIILQKCGLVPFNPHGRRIELQ